MSKSSPLYMTIIKRLTICFLFSTILTNIPFSIYYMNEKGFEARQAIFVLMLIATTCNFCFYILSFGGLLNLKSTIREDLNQSFYSFFTLPTTLSLTIISFAITNGTSYIDYVALVPSVIYLSTLYYHFRQFRKTVDEYEN